MFDPTYRPGDNLYTNSAISWDPDTGRMNWYFQFTPGDMWDYDEEGTHILIDSEVAGQPRKLITHSARNGYLYTMDQALGKQAKARAVPKHELHPVGPLRAEAVDRSGEWIGLQLLLQQGRQSVHALAKVHRLRRQEHRKRSFTPTALVP
jgi:glucose dehydrogenase